MRGGLLLFGGTTEGREILEYGLPAVCCVATNCGAEMLRNIHGVDIHVGRLDAGQISAFIREREICCVIDATHPYAATATANIKRACTETGTPLRRVLREQSVYSCAAMAESCEAAAEMLNRRGGRALLTTGSKNLAAFTAVSDFRERLFARVLPIEGAVKHAEALGFKHEHIIAERGPFTVEQNEALLRRTGAEVMVTKDGGAPGGTSEKLMAAKRLGIEVIVIRRPDDAGCTVRQAVFWARRVLGLPRPPFFPMYSDIENKKAIVVGGGPVALRRAKTLAECGAKVTVIAPVINSGFKKICCEMIERGYLAGDLVDAAIVISATDDRRINRLVLEEARQLGVTANVADCAEDCDFFFPSLTTAGGVTLSLSSAGVSPRLTGLVAAKMSGILPRLVEDATEECERMSKGAEMQ